MPTLSVIISAYNKDELACVHVRESQNSTCMPDEIIIIDDCGKPGLKEKLKKLDIKTKVIYARILEDIPWNYTGARNLGIWLSTGEIISVEDNDHIPDRNYYQDCLDYFEQHPECSRIKAIKRKVVEEEDALKNPYEEWVKVGSRQRHQDVTVFKRDLLLRLKGYDERFAGQYGWCATDINRRLNRLGVIHGEAGYHWVINTPKTRGLSYRNFKLARINKGTQPPNGLLNFTYEYEKLGDKE